MLRFSIVQNRTFQCVILRFGCILVYKTITGCLSQHFLPFFSAGQVLQHINLGDFVAKRVPSLKDFGKSISNGSDMGTLTLLRNAMQLLQRSVS